MVMVAVMMATAVVLSPVTTIEPLPSSSVSVVPSANASLLAALAIPSPPEFPSAPRTLPMNELAGAVVASFGISVSASADRADPSRAFKVPQCLMKILSVNPPAPPVRRNPLQYPGSLTMMIICDVPDRPCSLPKTPPLSRRSGLTRCFRSGIGPNTVSSSRSPLLPPRGGFSLTPYAPKVQSTANARPARASMQIHRHRTTGCCWTDMQPSGGAVLGIVRRRQHDEFMGFPKPPYSHGIRGPLADFQCALRRVARRYQIGAAQGGGIMFHTTPLLF